MKAILIGRFQPFHNGHLWAIKKILGENRSVTIAIGTAKMDSRNPLTYMERRRLIVDTLSRTVDKKRYRILALPDTPLDSDWLRKLDRISFDRAYTGNALTAKLLRSNGYQVIWLPRFRKISSTMIRRHISEGRPWKHLVPAAAVRLLRSSALSHHR